MKIQKPEFFFSLAGNRVRETAAAVARDRIFRKAALTAADPKRTTSWLGKYFPPQIPK